MTESALRTVAAAHASPHRGPGLALGLLLAAALLALPFGAPAHEGPERRGISVSGHAVDRVAPDRASVMLGVEGRGETADQAMAQAGQRVAALLDALTPLLDAEQVRALGTDLRRVVKGTDRHWIRDRGDPVEMLARRRVQLERIEVAMLPRAMRCITQQPLASIDQVQTEVSNAREIEDRLQLEAIAEARARAQRLAQSLGVTLGPPIDVQVDSHYAPQPKAMAADARMLMAESAESGAGYEQTGLETLEARVRLRFELIP